MRRSYIVIIGLLMFWVFGCSDHMLVDPIDDPSLQHTDPIDLDALAGEPFIPHQIRVGHVGLNGGQVAARAIIEVHEDLPGTFEFIDMAVFNSLSVEELRESFDVLIFPWQGNSSIDAQWESRLVPFMQLGGGIIWEDELNVGDLEPAITGTGGFLGGNGMHISDQVPILTDGITNELGNAFIWFDDYDQPPLSPFIMHPAGHTVGLWGKVGQGCFVGSGVLSNYYGHKSAGWMLNYYNLALNKLLFVATGCGNVEDVYPVDIVLRPGSGHNPVKINLNSNGVLPLAILSTADFDALQVDRETLKFGATGEEESLSKLGNGRPQCSEKDVNNNDLTDLVCHFRIQLMGFDYDSTEGILTGALFSGQQIFGSVGVQIHQGGNNK